MGNIFKKNNFFNDITYWINSEQVFSYSAGDVLTIKAEEVDADYKSLFTGIGFLASDGTTELTYTATSEGWDSEEPSNYVMTFTVPNTFSGDIYVTTKFNTTGMYDIDFNVTYDEGLVSPDYCSFNIRNNAIKKALPNTEVDLRVEAYVLDSSTQLSFDEFTTLTGISASAFSTWELVDNYSNYRIFECSFTMPSNNVAMTANFKEGSEPAITHTVTFKAGETTVDTVTVTEGTAIPSAEIPEAPSVTGKEFMFWADSNNKEFDFNTPITEDTTLTAYYAQAGSAKWLMSLPNCFVGLKSDVAELPIARVADGTKALALSANAGEEAAYMFNKATLTWIELQHYSVRI